MITLSDLYEKTVSVIQRRKQARRMAKMAKSPTFQFKKKKAALKMRNPAKLMQIARKKTIKSYRDKFYPEYNTMALQQRVIVDQRLQQKYGKKMAVMLKKAVAVLKKGELERVKQARASLRDSE